MLNDPLPGVPPKQLLWIEAVGDSQVPNIATESVARTMDIPLLSPTLEPIYGLTEQKGPLPSALVRYDLNPPADKLPGDTNNHDSSDNGVHAFVNFVDAVQEQIRTLFDEGVIRNECDGACDCTPTGNCG